MDHQEDSTKVDLMSSDIPWPSKDHDLRAKSDNRRAYAFLDWQSARGSQGRIMGYRRAAEILAEAMLSDPRNIRDLDTVIFPYAACWRHYVELQLKTLLQDFQALLDLPPRTRGGHNIKQLWSELRPRIVEAFPHEDNTDVDLAGGLIEQLGELDPGSQDFRYAKRRDGTPSLEGVDHLDIQEFHSAMLGVAHFLEAVESAVDHAKDLKSEALEYEYEMQAEYEAEMRQYYDS